LIQLLSDKYAKIEHKKLIFLNSAN
jgi:hypothetical protein